MSLAPTDQRDLVEPLFSGLIERPPWQLFLRRLIARTDAERAGLVLRGPGGAALDAWAQAFSVDRSVAKAREGLVGEPAPAGLRPLRVYTYAELIEISTPEYRTGAERRLAAASIAHGRYMRVPADPGWSAWIVLEHSLRDFTAADSALLSSLGPFLATAITLLRELDGLQRRAEIAEDALGALGASQVLLDRDRRIVTTDSGHLGSHSARVGGTLQLPGPRGADIARAMARLADQETAAVVIPDATRPERDLLLRTAPASTATIPLPGCAVVLTRAEPPPAGSGGMAEVLASRHGLSPREAELVAALARGEELVPAGVRLGLTPETTRNYSKRIYAKTGARGQAELVRLVLSGLAPFVRDS